MPTHVETLENGLKVVLRPIPDTKALSTWVVYRIGSRNEVPGMTGIGGLSNRQKGASRPQLYIAR